MIAMKGMNQSAATARTGKNAQPGSTKTKKTTSRMITTMETKRKLTDRTPKVLLSGEAEKQLRVWTQAAQGEFSCFGVTEQDSETGAIIVKKFFLPTQTCTDSHTSPDKESMGALMTDLVREGHSMEDLRCWAHSHADMNCFWSSEDADTIEQMDNGDWLLSIVVNKAGHFRARLDLYKPWRISVDQIKVGFLASIERDETLEKELEVKVHTPSAPWGLGWPDRQALADFDTEGFGYIDPGDGDVQAELQLVGLNSKQADGTVGCYRGVDRGVEEFWALLDSVLGGDGRVVDPSSVLQVLEDNGYIDRAL